MSAEYQQCLFHNPAEVDTIVLFPRILRSAQLCLLKIVTLSHCCNCLNKMIPSDNFCFQLSSAVLGGPSSEMDVPDVSRIQSEPESETTHTGAGAAETEKVIHD